MKGLTQMKKFLAITLVLAMMLAMSVVAMAASMIDADGGSAETTVTIQNSITENSNVDKVYAVDVTWDDLSFSITSEVSDDAIWDPETHTYNQASITSSTLDKTSANIVVTNHSNDEITATLTYGADAAGILSIAATIGSVDIADAAVNAYGDFAAAPTGTLTLGVSLIGDTNVASTSFTATVTIAAK